MKVTLTFELETDDGGHKEFLERYPGFEPETAEETLIREAIAQWEYEGLVNRVLLVNGRAVE